ncbi:hypothetical protein N136_04135, partial [Leifsonia aquatica ATCC 14665]
MTVTEVPDASVTVTGSDGFGFFSTGSISAMEAAVDGPVMVRGSGSAFPVAVAEAEGLAVVGLAAGAPAAHPVRTATRAATA